MKFVTINEGKVELFLHIRDRVPLTFDATPEGGNAFRKIVGNENFMCSSSVDFSHEYGLARSELERLFGL